MARLIWLTLMLALGAALLALTSMVAAYARVDNLLGAPPPQMGESKTTFLWDGMPKHPEHPRVWLFSYGPTSIPGAPKVRIYVSPIGRLIRTEPADLADRLKAFHNRGY